MFTKTAKFYDAIYSFKDYPKEAQRIHEVIESHLKSGGNDLVDVACGTGKHLFEFTKWFNVYGVDIDPELLKIASGPIQEERLYEGDMRTFELGFKVDVVTCLFSSVAYMTTLDEMRKAVANMVRHLKPGGVFVMEPFLYPESWTPGFLHFLHVDEPELKIARMSRSEQEGKVAVLNFEYLIGTLDGVFRESERHELGLFHQNEYEEAMSECGLTVDYDPIGPMGRGLFVGVK